MFEYLITEAWFNPNINSTSSIPSETAVKVDFGFVRALRFILFQHQESKKILHDPKKG